MSRSRTLAFAAVVAAALVTTACSSDPTGPKPSFSCESQGSNTAQGCPTNGPH
jgi:hypothetical protein